MRILASRRRLVGLSLTLMLAVSALAPVTASATEPGCTPGFWKNHTGLGPQANAWGPVSPSQLFSATGAPPGSPSEYFNDMFPGMTLLQVLNLGGGGLNALGRHTVAAYLNSINIDPWTLSTTAVVRRFNWATDGDPSTGLSIEDQKNQFAGYNEFGTCPLP